MMMRQIPEEHFVRKKEDILEQEGIYVHTPSPFAKENLYYIQLEALYTCGPSYEVSRSGLDSFLLFFIKEGALLFTYEGESFSAGPGDVVLLDCRRPHRYQAQGGVKFYWFHFDGGASGAYFDHFRNGSGVLFRGHRKMEEQFVLVHDQMRSDVPDEGLLSVQIHRILALLFASAGSGSAPSESTTVEPLDVMTSLMRSASAPPSAVPVKTVDRPAISATAVSSTITWEASPISERSLPM